MLIILGAVAVMLACAWAFGGTPVHGASTTPVRSPPAWARTSRRSRARSSRSRCSTRRCSAPPPSRSPAPTPSATTSASSTPCTAAGATRRTFHGTYAAFIAIAAIVVLLPGAPLGLITTGVQALAGILLPSATVFLLLLCNDRDVLGPWVNPRWLNALAALVVGVLVVLSTLLTITTIFPGVDMATLCLGLFGLLAVVLIAAAVMSRRPPPAPAVPRQYWTMPALETLPARAVAIRRLARSFLRASSSSPPRS